MDISSAIKLQEKYSSLTKNLVLQVGKQKVLVEGVFVAPSNPSLLDSYINFIWREGLNAELFQNELPGSFFRESENLDWEVYVKLGLQAENAPDYFLYEKLSDLPEVNAEEEKVYV